jgi:hypothetical protein
MCVSHRREEERVKKREGKCHNKIQQCPEVGLWRNPGSSGSISGVICVWIHNVTLYWNYINLEVTTIWGTFVFLMKSQWLDFYHEARCGGENPLALRGREDPVNLPPQRVSQKECPSLTQSQTPSNLMSLLSPSHAISLSVLLTHFYSL